MREEVRLKFEREVRKQWIARGAMAAGFLAVIAVAAWFTDLDAHVEKRQVAGVIEKISPLPGGMPQAVQNGLSVDVKLADGRHAVVVAEKSAIPGIGTEVAIVEHVHGSGRTTFSWK
jgi:hypothetical protein